MSCTICHVMMFPEHRTWRAMIARCLDPEDPTFPRYGGRGITVDLAWLDFKKFYADMGPRPPGKTLERINNLGSYSKSNCKWASTGEQARNRRSNVFITIDGVSKVQEDWCNEFGIPRSTFRYRVKTGWTPKEALGIT